MAPRSLDTVVFDLGQVLLGWDPAPAFAQAMPADQVAGFLDLIDFHAWNHANDAGRSFADGERLLIETFPEHADAILAYRREFPRTLTGMVPGTAAVVAELQRAGVRLLALTNWSAETFPHAAQRFGILNRFEEILVSGAEGLAKPDPAIFRLLCERFGVDPARAVFVDDAPANVAAARSTGLTGIEFVGADELRSRLVELGLLGQLEPVTDPIYHLAERRLWLAAQDEGAYPWSTRGATYDAQGFVHCSFAEQLPVVRSAVYGDLPDGDLVVLELDPARLSAPVVVEDLAAGEPFPHLYGPLRVEDAVEVSSP